MTRVATWLLSAGALLFIGVLASQGMPAVMATLSLAGWGLLRVALFHLLPLVLDAAARFSERPTDQEMQALSDRRQIEPLFV